MGEISEMYLDGTLCECCGSVMPDVDKNYKPHGYPRTCDDCQEIIERNVEINSERPTPDYILDMVEDILSI